MATRLYIGNLSWDTTEETLQSVLTEDGRTLRDLHMVMDRETGRPRGFAFAEFNSEAEAQAAIESMDGMNLEGRELRVNVAQERPKRGGGGGGRY
ncbi:MAG TPA: RNA-binding protein [Planctomycetes bacterium]|nr:RNA-binding protein [Planctomycetota bacterium]